MAVLRAFRSDRTPLSNAELVVRTGLSKATVSRLTSTLVQLDYLRQVPAGRKFELGTASLEIGHAYLAGSGMLETATPFLQALAERLEVSVALAIRDGLDMLYVGYRASLHVATLRLGTGSVLPIALTAAGHAFLWALPLPERKALMVELGRLPGSSARLRRSIQTSFTELDRTGTCALFGEYQRDSYAVALPVHLGRERTLMALSCGNARVQADLPAERHRIAPELKKAAVQLEKLLAGFSGVI